MWKILVLIWKYQYIYTTYVVSFPTLCLYTVPCTLFRQILKICFLPLPLPSPSPSLEPVGREGLPGVRQVVSATATLHWDLSGALLCLGVGEGYLSPWHNPLKSIYTECVFLCDTLGGPSTSRDPLLKCGWAGGRQWQETGSGENIKCHTQQRVSPTA